VRSKRCHWLQGKLHLSPHPAVSSIARWLWLATRRRRRINKKKREKLLIQLKFQNKTILRVGYLQRSALSSR
jgi:hypothetical protein